MTFVTQPAYNFRFDIIKVFHNITTKNTTYKHDFFPTTSNTMGLKLEDFIQDRHTNIFLIPYKQQYRFLSEKKNMVKYP